MIGGSISSGNGGSVCAEIPGLKHTFIGDGFDLSKPPYNMVTYNLCKSQNQNSSCSTTWDFICDTGLDPWSLDVGPSGVSDNVKDFDKWVNYATCTQKTELQATYIDGCMDSQTSWNIPVNNYMSYYRKCRKEFTPCQFATAYWSLTHPGLGITYTFLMNCNSDPYPQSLICSADNITVSTPTTWSNQNIQLCPGQKIIIKPTGSLTINNCTLTRVYVNPPNSSCLNLFYDQMWDGIYIEGNNPATTLTFNGSNVYYSKNGIQSQNDRSTVNINSCTFENNLTQINLESKTISKMLSGGWVFIRNSNFTVAPSDLSATPLAQSQINILGKYVYIDHCTITNPNSQNENQLTAIRTGLGNLKIRNASKIENFHIGVNKTGDLSSGGSGRGVSIYDSFIKNCEYSITNTSQYLYANNNVFQGEIVSEGICYSRLLSNNIRANHITLHSPIQSNRFENNLFNSAELELYRTNDLTYSLCDTWENIETSGHAFLGISPITLPPSWGGDEGNGRYISSGNRHLDELNPHFYAEFNLANYYFNNHPTEHFLFDPSPSLVNGLPAPYVRTCLNNYPAVPREYNPNFTEEIFNFSEENNNWLSLNTFRIQKETALTSASTNEIPPLLQEINYTKFQMSDIVGRVLSNLTPTDSLILSLWLSRVNPIILKCSDLTELWYSIDFNAISNKINLSDGEDAQSFLTAAEYAKKVSTANNGIDSLNLMELDTLSKIASLTFGDYTNIVRDFLRLKYNIDIPWPLDRNAISPRSSDFKTRNHERKQEKIFSIKPNPSDGCFTIDGSISILGKIYLKIYNLEGKELKAGIIYLGDRICFDNIESGIYILTLFDPQSNTYELQKLILN